MAAGPILIFDKSTLESLNPDEAALLDNFFLTNITPLFFVETLADLEKDIRSGRAPEHVVGNIAYKTPDLQSRPNIHHHKLLVAELTGRAVVEMGGRPIISGGTAVTLEDTTGVYFQQAPEQEALTRWHRGEFRDVERQIARRWRQELAGIDFEEAYKAFRIWYTGRKHPDSLSEVYDFAYDVLANSEPESALNLGLGLLGISEVAQETILQRWQDQGEPPVQEFAPYFAHVAAVDLFFYLAVAADLISRSRPSNKVDLAYLYYLPFCMVFASNDKLHARTVPLFLRANQSFVSGADLKSDLRTLDRHYSALPEEVKRQGLLKFAGYPPEDGQYLVTRLWDKHLPTWRESATQYEPRSTTEESSMSDQISTTIEQLRAKARSESPSVAIDSDDVDHLVIERRVLARKGKWRRFPPEVERRSQSDAGRDSDE